MTSGAAAAGAPADRRYDVVIVGGGVSGIGTAAMLHRAGFGDFVLLERADALGGTWHHNTYPDCACDIPSHLYQFAFRPKPDWSRVFADRSEIERYLLDIAAEHDVPARTRFGTEMLGADWDGENWVVTTNDGVYRGRMLVIATGALHEARTEIPGIERFRGRAFHSSSWPAGYDGAGERVAVIGTGASSIQITPALARTAEHVTVFQRTPAWIQPRPNLRLPGAVLRRFPVLGRLLRWFMWVFGELMLLASLEPWLGRLIGLIPRANLRWQVRDPELRRALTPDYVMGCKRLLVSSQFYPALTRSNVDLVASAVAEVTEDSVVAADGTRARVDTIVHATGFHFGLGVVARLLRRPDGTTLAEAWDGSPRAYLGTTVAGFPNLVLMWGPNSGTASLCVTVESQIRYLIGMLRAMHREGVSALEVRPEAEAGFRARAAARTAHSVVNTGGCQTWYLDEKGHNQLVWPGTMVDMWRTLSRFDRERYRVVHAPGQEINPGGAP
jgi:cyclohexanone monooxygenase